MRIIRISTEVDDLLVACLLWDALHTEYSGNLDTITKTARDIRLLQGGRTRARRLIAEQLVAYGERALDCGPKNWTSFSDEIRDSCMATVRMIYEPTRKAA